MKTPLLFLTLLVLSGFTPLHATVAFHQQDGIQSDPGTPPAYLSQMAGQLENETPQRRTPSVLSGWNPLQQADLSAISPASIADYLIDRPEAQGVTQDINYFIAHFHRLANAVRTQDPAKGFIDISVWRNVVDNEPYNARIMENITTLAWFYTQYPEWNPFHADEDLRLILEAALRFWVSIQNSDGRFSEYGENRWNLAATAFATKFMEKTLEMLADGPPIDADLHEEVIQANRRALMVVFTDPSLYQTGIRFSNQFGNAFTGALAHLNRYPEDEELRTAFESRLQSSLDDFQSPAGYFYENFGPDWSYAFGTHHSNVLMAWHYARHIPDMAEHYAYEHAKFIDWLAYNAVLQPDDGVFVLHSSIQSRQNRNTLFRLESPLSEVVPLARAFNVTREEADQRLASARQRVTSNWLNVPSLRVGDFDGYGAYSFLHRSHYRWNPTETQRQEAVQMLPYLASEDFVHQRVDNLTHFETTFIRKPSYYAAFSAGEQSTDQQRFGLGLLWSPQAGALLQSQSRRDDSAWGTRTVSNRIVSVWEALPVDATYTLDGQEIDPETGVRDLDGSVLQVTYPLGSTGIFSGIGSKTITFGEEEITVDVTHNGPFTEILPLLVNSASELQINTETGVIQTFRLGQSGYEKLRIVVDNPEALTSITTLNTRSVGADLLVLPVHITTNGNLTYTITVTPAEPLSSDGKGSLMEVLPGSFRLVGNYPNPFNPSTDLVFELRESAEVQLQIFDITGKQVHAEHVGFRMPGRHSTRFEASHLASGVYLVRMEAGGEVQQLPVTLLK